MAWVWKQPLPPTDKFVLLALADHAADDDFECWPSLSHLETKTGYTRTTIWRSIDRLIQNGAVKRVGESKAGSTTYQVQVGKQLTLGAELTQVTTSPRVGAEMNINQVTTSPRVGADVTSNHQLTITEPSLNHHTAGLDAVAWTQWIEYRKQIRKPLKQASMPAAQRKLAAFGSDQGAIVQQSIANGWQGLFPLHAGNSRTSRKTFEDYQGNDRTSSIPGSAKRLD